MLGKTKIPNSAVGHVPDSIESVEHFLILPGSRLKGPFEGWQAIIDSAVQFESSRVT